MGDGRRGGGTEMMTIMIDPEKQDGQDGHTKISVLISIRLARTKSFGQNIIEECSRNKVI